MIWWLATAVAAVVLLAHLKGPNAVWGTATLGALVGVVIAAFRPGFDWSTVGKAVVVGTFAGLAFEWLPRMVKSRTAAFRPPLGTGNYSYLRVRWSNLPPTNPIETWSELDAERNEVRSVRIWADGRVEYACRDEEIAGARLSDGPVPQLTEFASAIGFKAEPETVSESDFEHRWQAKAR